jgi:hypothetical protein
MTENSNQLSAIKQTANSILERDVDELLVIPPLAIKLLCLTSDNARRATELSVLIISEPALANPDVASI